MEVSLSGYVVAEWIAHGTLNAQIVGWNLSAASWLCNILKQDLNSMLASHHQGVKSPGSDGKLRNMCISNRVTMLIGQQWYGSLVTCMLPRELIWKQVASPRKGMTQWMAWAEVVLVIVKKSTFWCDEKSVEGHYINEIYQIFSLFYKGCTLF